MRGGRNKEMKFAIYGFYFTREFSFNNLYFTPNKRNVSFWEGVNISKDKYQYNLTGYIDTPELEVDKFIFVMQAVLTFVQQQDVSIKLVTNKNPIDFFSSDFERRGTGAPFAMYCDLQEEIVGKLYIKLNDNNDLCNQKDNNSVFGNLHNCEFRSLVYKVIEPLHMRRNFIEMSYFLYFSGLEAFCKQYLKSYYPEINIVKDASKNIAQMLEKLEINYIQVDTSDMNYNLRNHDIKKEDFLKLSLSTYSNLRNSLFHENLFVAETESSIIRDSNGKYLKEDVLITNYVYNLHRLCNVVIIKYIGVENSRFDSSKWYTRFPLVKSVTGEN